MDEPRSDAAHDPYDPYNLLAVADHLAELAKEISTIVSAMGQMHTTVNESLKLGGPDIIRSTGEAAAKGIKTEAARVTISILTNLLKDLNAHLEHVVVEAIEDDVMSRKRAAELAGVHQATTARWVRNSRERTKMLSLIEDMRNNGVDE